MSWEDDWGPLFAVLHLSARRSQSERPPGTWTRLFWLFSTDRSGEFTLVVLRLTEDDICEALFPRLHGLLISGTNSAASELSLRSTTFSFLLGKPEARTAGYFGKQV